MSGSGRGSELLQCGASVDVCRPTPNFQRRRRTPARTDSRIGCKVRQGRDRAPAIGECSTGWSDLLLASGKHNRVRSVSNGRCPAKLRGALASVRHHDRSWPKPPRGSRCQIAEPGTHTDAPFSVGSLSADVRKVRFSGGGGVGSIVRTRPNGRVASSSRSGCQDGSISYKTGLVESKQLHSPFRYQGQLGISEDQRLRT